MQRASRLPQKEIEVDSRILSIWEEFESRLIENDIKDDKNVGKREKLKKLILNQHDDIKKSTAILAIEKLKSTLKKWPMDYRHLSNQDIPYCAAALFAEDPQYLSWTEFTTLLELHQATLLPPPLEGKTVTKTNFLFFKHEEKIAPPIVKVYPILTPKGDFTENAKEFLLHALNNDNFFRQATATDLEKWRQLLFNFQQHNIFNTVLDNLFFIQEPSKEELHYDRLALAVGRFKMMSLQPKETSLQSFYYPVRLSALSRHLLGLVMFGDNYRPAILTLGNKTPRDIINGVLRGIRWGAVYFPGLEIKNVHDQPFSFTSASVHDDYHGKVFTLLGNYIKIHFYIADLIRKEMLAKIYPDKSPGSLISKEVWDLFDADIPFILMDDSLLIEDIFYKVYFEKIKHHEIFCRDIPEESDIFSKMSCITDVGIHTVLNMVKIQDRWEELKFNCQNLKGLLKMHFQLMSTLNSLNKDLFSNIITYRIILHISQRLYIAGIKNCVDELKRIEILIEPHLKMLTDQCQLFKTKNNQISLCLKDGKPIDNLVQSTSLMLISDTQIFSLKEKMKESAIRPGLKS